MPCWPGPDGGVNGVAAQGQLAVGSGRAVPPAFPEPEVGEELADGRRSPVPAGQRGHRPGGVLGEQADQRAGVGLLERVDERFYQSAGPLVAQGAGRPLLIGFCVAASQALPGPLQGTCHRRHRVKSSTS